MELRFPGNGLFQSLLVHYTPLKLQGQNIFIPGKKQFITESYFCFCNVCGDAVQKISLAQNDRYGLQ